MEVALASTEDAVVSYSSLDKQWIDLTQAKSGEVRLSFSSSVWERDLFLVIDIYDASNPVHPEGHVGWWKYSLQEKRGDVTVSVDKDKNSMRILFDGQAAVDRWVNPAFSGVGADVLSLHIVLRQTLSEAIESDDTIFIYNSASAFQMAADRRASIDCPQGEPASMPWYVWPSTAKAHVVAANLFEQDAVGNFTFAIHRLMKTNGISCQLYAGNFDPYLRPAVRHISDLLGAVNAHDLVFFNFSIYDPYMQLISQLPCRKILYFHNITPPRFFQIYDAEHAAHCAQAVDQLKLLPSFDKVIANSVSSGRVLQNLTSHHRAPRRPNGQASAGRGGPFDEASRLLEQAAQLIEQQHETELEVKICPPFMNVNRWYEIVAEPVAIPPQSTLLLYVGRVAPHKHIEDLLSLYREYHKLDPDSALLVAGVQSFEGYSSYLRYRMQNEFKDLRSHVHFFESVSDGQLKTLYPAASAFVTMSEHEGFCVPLVESMVFDTPIFAYATDAVIETLGRSGRLFYEKDFANLAADIHDVIKKPWKRNRIIAEQQRRLAQITVTIDGSTIWSTIEELFFQHCNS